MKLPQLTEGILQRRYKRFLADVQLPDGSELTVHVPNTGSLLGCIREGSPAWIIDHGEGRRKYRHSLFLVKPGQSRICVDTSWPNKLVSEAAREQQIDCLAGFHEYVTEVPYGNGSRVDLLCRTHRDDMLRRCWVEVKATTLEQGKVAMFPDAVTPRGRRHLSELANMVAQGDRAVQLFVIQRADCSSFRPADHIDPAYGAALREAAQAGVELLALSIELSKQQIKIGRPLPVEL